MKNISACILICVLSLSFLSAQWAGTWKTNFGELRLHQSGNIVVGDYALVGEIEGTVKPGDKSLSGTFYNRTQKRKGYFTFRLQGNQLVGKWGWSKNLNGDWTGSRTSSQQPELKSAQFRAWRGKWNSSFGELRFHQEGGRVYGDYANKGTISGSFNPVSQVFAGTFNNKSLKKKGYFSFTLANSKFTGKWGWDRNMTNGAWTGSRISSALPTLTSLEYKKGKILTVQPPFQAQLPLPVNSNIKSASIRLPFHTRHQTIRYTLDGAGNMLMDDIVLGKEKDVLARHGQGKVNDWYRGQVPNQKAVLNRPQKGPHRVITQGLNAINDFNCLWPFGVIPYRFNRNLSSAEKLSLTNAMDNIEKSTSLRFVIRNSSNHPDYIEFFKDATIPGCGRSPVGRKGGKQIIRIAPGCFTDGTIIHEIFHSVGVWHEQSRADRDSYVTIVRKNIANRSNVEHNFDKHVETSVAMTDYDYNSIMHYSSGAFAKSRTSTIICNSNRSDCPAPSTFGGNRMSRLDIEGINRLYPITLEYQGGHDWGGSAATTDISFGDIDGDGKDEIAVVRKSDTNGRIYVFDDAENNYKLLLSAGEGWGKGYYAVEVAFGDLDGDGKEELAVARNAKENSRVMVYRYQGGTIRKLGDIGSDWGGNAYATSVAFGDMDGDGKAELAVSRKSSSNSRVFLYTYNASSRSFSLRSKLGSNWKSTDYATSVAFGDYNNDNKDELAIGRRVAVKGRFRYAIYQWNSGQLKELVNGGQDWGEGAYVTDLAFGDVDGSSGEELGVTRFTQSNGRVYIIGKKNGQNQPIKTFGQDWGKENYATSIDFGDTDGDGKDEIFIGRKSNVNSRIFLYDDRADGYDLIFSNGTDWFSGYGRYVNNVYATTVAMGDTNGDGVLEFAVGLNSVAKGNPRWHIFK